MLLGTTTWSCASAPEEPFREYTSGRVTEDDFQAEAPEARVENGILIQAHIWTGLRWTYRWSFVTRDGSTTVRVQAFEVSAIVKPERSWKRKTLGAALLDHEQGHFDIAELHARRARREFERAKPDLVVVDPDKDKAVTELRKRIGAITQGWNEALDKDQGAYDEATRHGTRVAEQAEHRQRHRDSLARDAANGKRRERRTGRVTRP